MNLFPHPFDDAAVFLVGVSIVIGAMAVIWSKVIKPTWRLVVHIVRADLPYIMKMLEEIREMSEELLPNDGSSIKDRVAKLIEGQDEIGSNVRMNTLKLHEIEKQLENHRIVDHGNRPDGI